MYKRYQMSQLCKKRPLNSLTVSICFLCASIHVLASLSHLVPFYRAHAWTLLATRCYQRQKTTIRHDDHTGRRGKGRVMYFTSFTTAVLETMRLEKSSSMSSMTHNHFLLTCREEAHVRMQSLLWCSQTKCYRTFQECTLLQGDFVMNDVQDWC